MSLLARLTRRPAKTALPTTPPVKNPGCGEFEVDAWQLSAFVIKRLLPVVGMRPFPLNELMLLSAAVCRFTPSFIFEWGTHVGQSARAFYEITRHYGINCRIHSVDLPDDISHVEHPRETRGLMVKGLARVHLHQGDGLEVSLKLWESAGRPDRVVFFVDGDHSEHSVYRELAGITNAVPRPVVLLHDTFYQSSDSGYNVGPHRAIERIMQEHPQRFKRLDSGLGLPGMSLLCPRDLAS
jgi:cephalosporin hydroxylase